MKQRWAKHYQSSATHQHELNLLFCKIPHMKNYQAAIASCDGGEGEKLYRLDNTMERDYNRKIAEAPRQLRQFARITLAHNANGEENPAFLSHTCVL